VVGGITLRAGVVIGGLSVDFVKLDKDHLDLIDKYTSDWVGGDVGGKATIGGQGQFFVGVTGHLNDSMSPCSFGLITVLQK
jgi:hypothetical protein